MTSKNMYNAYYVILIAFVPILFHASLVNAINNSVGDQNEFWKEVKNIVNGLSEHHLIEFHHYLQMKMDESARHDCVTCFQVCFNLDFLTLLSLFFFPHSFLLVTPHLQMKNMPF